MSNSTDRNENEMTFAEIYIIFVNYKFVFIGIFLASILLGGVYSYFSKRVYQATALIMSPVASEMSFLYKGVARAEDSKLKEQFFSSEIYRLSKNDLSRIYSDLKLFLAEEAVWSEFVNAHNELTDDLDSKVLKLGDSISVERSDSQSRTRFTVSYNSANKKNINYILRNYIDFASRLYFEELVIELKNRKEQALQDVQEKISYLTHLAKFKKEQEIAELENHIKIAKAIESKNERLPRGIVAQPKYLLGSEILKTELELLKIRDLNNVKVSGLAELQAIKINLNKQKPSIKDVSYLFQIRGVLVRDEPLRPRISLIMVISTSLGLFLGIIAVFTVDFIQKTVLSPKSK